MSHIFILAIGDKFETAVRRTTRKFEKDMETFTLINKLQRLDVKHETPVKSENPPEQLVEFYPLAEYCNGLISAFNDLRLCAPVALSDTCARLLQDSLHNVAKAMLIFYKQEQQAFTAAERENMVKFAECLSDQLVPYVQYCIHAIFPPSQVASHLGITVSQLQKEGVTYLGQKLIIEPLAPLLPIRVMPTDPIPPKVVSPSIQFSESSKDAIPSNACATSLKTEVTPLTPEMTSFKVEEIPISNSEETAFNIEQATASSNNELTTSKTETTIKSEEDKSSESIDEVAMVPQQVESNKEI